MTSSAPIWTPSPDDITRAAITRFAVFAGQRTGLDLGAYRDLWAWSVRDLPAFWAAVADFYDLGLDTGSGPGAVLAEDRMPGARWFPGGQLNYAGHALRHALSPDLADTVAVTAVTENGSAATVTWAQLRAQAGAFAATLRGLGVRPGMSVVGYLPNTAETLVAFLASASIGAVWSACAQDYSAAGAASRFAQLDPVVLVAADGYRWNGREIDRRDEVAELRQRLPTLRAVVSVPYLGLGADSADARPWSAAIATPAELEVEPTAFDDPLWVLFSSGTTGRPKGIVHGHGGIVLEHCKMLGLHLDAGPGRPLFWYTSTNWMMWNIVAAGLLVGAPVVLYDGSPTYPGPLRLWQVAADHGAATLGVSPGYLTACDRAGLHPGADLDLSRLRTLGVTGAPLTAGPYYWVRDQVGPHVQTASSSGGTDVASGFAGGTPVTPVWAGEISGPMLGVALESWDEAGQPNPGQVGELVVTRPMPSMPLRFWDDPDGARYREAYFSAWPGVWRHGDWMEITGHGGVIVSGRSDATLNRHGVRLGSAEIYTAVDVLPEITDSLVIGAELGDGDYWLVLFVVLASGASLSPALVSSVKEQIRTQTSPRHVPDDIIAVPVLPHTRTGKRLEIPVKRIIQGQLPEAVAGADAIDDYAALTQFTVYAGGPARRASQEAR